ncbi:hypothetical protein [Caldicellulosiruptor saccharolyticus]|uniref:hypothetical protein n=1 Tax=Caldicellulosiruptor saccharolyticus TaxID=44001 RepID=UPI0002EE64C7|nr:hypothetical protein [Caldicellulosiruptor saccharolyticus]
MNNNQLLHNINDLEYKYVFSNKSIFLRLLKKLDEIEIFKNLDNETKVVRSCHFFRICER